MASPAPRKAFAGKGLQEISPMKSTASRAANRRNRQM
jgi:hypothetical protein